MIGKVNICFLFSYCPEGSLTDGRLGDGVSVIAPRRTNVIAPTAKFSLTPGRGQLPPRGK